MAGYGSPSTPPRLRQMLDDLKRSNEELESFTYIASHDLRSPLINLKGFAGQLQCSIEAIEPLLLHTLPSLSKKDQARLKKELHQHIPKALQHISSSVEKMDRLINAILQLSRAGHREMDPERINTNALVDACLRAMEHQIQQRRISVRVPRLPVIMGDRIGIEQLFSNLLDNAVKYHNPARRGKIRISAKHTPTYVHFTVEDNGRGIAPDDLHKVFEIFRRGSNVGTIPGEGMGMPYVRTIVRRHGGTIWCESTAGEGTAFHFTIARCSAGRRAA